ncbi:MAG TPA: hypothetical protein VEP49_12720 [Acidimicrobiia bacterium]|nr:hypothetical protein [Acidimicrobiia bacterium]
MSILDKMKETAQKGVDKTKEAVSAGQEKLDQRKLEKQVSDLKEELGGVVYAQKTGTADASAEAEITRIVGEIKTAEEQLAASGDRAGDSGDEAAAGPATETTE